MSGQPRLVVDNALQRSFSVFSIQVSVFSIQAMSCQPSLMAGGRRLMAAS
jgi:hypothetical protein